jgi:hypothetical protein
MKAQIGKFYLHCSLLPKFFIILAQTNLTTACHEKTTTPTPYTALYYARGRRRMTVRNISAQPAPHGGVAFTFTLPNVQKI